MQVPTFEDFPAPDGQVTTWASSVDIEGQPFARRFLPQLEAALKSGPNFAGYLAVVEIEHRPGFLQTAIVDLKTGKPVWWKADIGADEYRYRTDSRLFVVEKHAEPRPVSIDPTAWVSAAERQYLVWSGGDLQLLVSTESLRNEQEEFKEVLALRDRLNSRAPVSRPDAHALADLAARQNWGDCFCDTVQMEDDAWSCRVCCGYGCCEEEECQRESWRLHVSPRSGEVWWSGSTAISKVSFAELPLDEGRSEWKAGQKISPSRLLNTRVRWLVEDALKSRELTTDDPIP
jgi:hypothetical protein